MNQFEPTDAYVVVVNDEEQYSIWPARIPIPLGWQQVGAADTRENCLSHVKRVWTDLRPKSLRDKMDMPMKSM